MHRRCLFFCCEKGVRYRWSCLVDADFDMSSAYALARWRLTALRWLYFGPPVVGVICLRVRKSRPHVTPKVSLVSHYCQLSHWLFFYYTFLVRNIYCACWSALVCVCGLYVIVKSCGLIYKLNMFMLNLNARGKTKYCSRSLSHPGQGRPIPSHPVSNPFFKLTDHFFTPSNQFIECLVFHSFLSFF